MEIRQYLMLSSKILQTQKTKNVLYGNRQRKLNTHINGTKSI